jgi:hypothetical protein
MQEYEHIALTGIHLLYWGHGKKSHELIPNPPTVTFELLRSPLQRTSFILPSSRLAILLTGMLLVIIFMKLSFASHSCLLGLVFDHEDGSDVFLRNVC